MGLNTSQGVDFKSLLWLFLVALQIIGSSRLDKLSDTSANIYDDLILESNVIFAVLFLVNFIVRRFLFIEDTSYYFISRFSVMIRVQWLVDIPCMLVTLIYTLLGIDLLFELRIIF